MAFFRRKNKKTNRRFKRRGPKKPKLYRVINKQIMKVLNSQRELKVYESASTSLGEFGLTDANGSSDASGVTNGYWSGSTIQAAADIGQGDDSDQRIGDQIHIKDQIVKIRFISQGVNTIDHDTHIKFMLVKVKLPLPESSFDITQMFDEDLRYRTLNPNHINITFMTPWVRRNKDYLKSYKIIDQKMVKVPMETSTSAVGFSREVTLRFKPKKPVKLTFDEDTGALTNWGLRLLIFASEGNVGGAGTGTTAVQPAVSSIAANSGFYFSRWYTTHYYDS